MKKFIMFLFLVMMVLSFSVSTFAADVPVSSGSSSALSTYPAGPIQKAERGISNVLFGWTEIPKRIVDKTRETNPIKGVFIGLFEGTLKAFARTASGIGDIVTFPIGGYDKPAIIPDVPALD